LSEIESGWVAVGILWRARGNRGELLAEIYSAQPGRAERLKDVLLVLGERKLPIQVERVWEHDGRTVFKFVGIDTISQAEEWQGADILAPEAERAAPGEGEYSYADLIGCKLIELEKEIGVVRSIEEYGGTPLLKLEAVDGHEILVPFARAICREIDVAGKVIRAVLPVGLTEL
jgi:16S rRNA processing protein RimM